MWFWKLHICNFLTVLSISIDYTGYFRFDKKTLTKVFFNKMSFFGGSKRQLRILTLGSQIKYENGNYALSFDVIKNSDHYEKVKRERRKEEQVYCELPCIASPCSGDIDMTLSANKICQFKFTVSGALKPSSQLEQGEDILEYNDKSEWNRKHIYLVPTYDESSEGRANIKFWDEENVKHTVTILDVPTEKLDTSMRSNNSESDTTSLKSVGDTVDAGSFRETNRTIRTQTVREEGSLMPPGINQAKPVNPNTITGGPTYVPPQPNQPPPAQAQVNQALVVSMASDDLEEEEAQAYGKVLSAKSLTCLAHALTPQDCETLLIHLEVPSEAIEQKKKNYPGDIVNAMFQCMLEWKKEKKRVGENTHDKHVNKHMYDDLIKQLRDIKRNDIKRVLENALKKGKELEKQDFSDK